jgi:chromosome segregation ATPase
MIESLQLESQQIALREASERCEETRRTRDQLEDDCRRLKADNQRRLADFRQRVERKSEKLERATGLLRSQVKEKRNELASAQAKLEADGRFKEIRDREQHIQRTLKSFVDCQETIAALANLLQFSPLADSEFDVIAETGAFQSPMGQAVAGFIAASKKVLVKKQDEV